MNDTTFQRQFQKSSITNSHSTVTHLLDSTLESHAFEYNSHYSNAPRFLLVAIHTEKSPDRLIGSIYKFSSSLQRLALRKSPNKAPSLYTMERLVRR